MRRARQLIRIVGRVGSVHAVRGAKVDGTRLTFADPAWDLTVKDRKLTGRTPDGMLSGVPSPALNRKPPAAWTVPEPLLFSAWQADQPSNNHWITQTANFKTRPLEQIFALRAPSAISNSHRIQLPARR